MNSRKPQTYPAARGRYVRRAMADDEVPLLAGLTGDVFLDSTHYCALHGKREWNGSHEPARKDGGG